MELCVDFTLFKLGFVGIHGIDNIVWIPLNAFQFRDLFNLRLIAFLHFFIFWNGSQTFYELFL